MSEVKPMGVEQAPDNQRRDRNPKTRRGVTGFPQEYNQDPGPSQELNPDAVVDVAVLPNEEYRQEAEQRRAQREQNAQQQQNQDQREDATRK